MPKSKDKLSYCQREFLKHYFAGNCKNASEAIKKSGYTGKYPEKIAWQRLNLPVVKKEVERYQRECEKKISVTLEDTISLLWKIANDNRDTDKADVSIKAISEINKMLGRYAPEKVHNINENISHEIREIKEIRAMYKKDI